MFAQFRVYSFFQVCVTYMLPEQDNTQKRNTLEIRFLHQTPHRVNSQ